MHLISCLASGVTGAENGRAEIYIRGTTDRAAYYTDFEGAQKVTTGADVALDAVGGAVVYVDSLVRVVVRDVNGQVFREFVPGVTAGTVELISQSATGKDYATGQTAVGSPTTVQQFLDELLGSFGTTDWDVVTTGQSVVSALLTLAGSIFNVKDPRWGAKGDSVTDDTAAVNACIDACDAAGGGIVFVPPGYYLITGSLSLNSKVSLVGCGANITALINPAGIGHVLTLAAATGVGWQRVANMTISLVGGSGSHVSVTAAARTIFENVTFYGASGKNSGPVVNVSAPASLIFTNCDFMPGTLATAVPINITQMASVRLRDCRLLSGLGPDTYMVLANTTATGSMWIDGCMVDLSSNTLGIGGIRIDATSGAYFVMGCYFIPRTDSGTLINVSGVGTTQQLYDAGNAMEGAPDIAHWGNGSTVAGGHVASRMHRVKEINDDSATITLQTGDYGTFIIRRTSATVQTINFVAGFEGEEMTLVYWNDTAGATGNISFGANIRASTSPFTVNANSMSIFHFRYVKINSNSRWCQVSTLNANVAE